jgi:hypothetical protein
MRRRISRALSGIPRKNRSETVTFKEKCDWSFPMKRCILEDKVCCDCRECDMCDVNKDKVCDNCGKCIDTDAEYYGIAINKIILPDE